MPSHTPKVIPVSYHAYPRRRHLTSCLIVCYLFFRNTGEVLVKTQPEAEELELIKPSATDELALAVRKIKERKEMDLRQQEHADAVNEVVRTISRTKRDHTQNVLSYHESVKSLAQRWYGFSDGEFAELDTNVRDRLADIVRQRCVIRKRWFVFSFVSYEVLFFGTALFFNGWAGWLFFFQIFSLLPPCVLLVAMLYDVITHGGETSYFLRRRKHFAGTCSCKNDAARYQKELALLKSQAPVPANSSGPPAIT